MLHLYIDLMRNRSGSSATVKRIPINVLNEIADLGMIVLLLIRIRMT